MSHKQSRGAVLCLLYCYVTRPDKVTEKAEMTSCAMLKRFVKMQASWVRLKPQTKPRGCVDPALLPCANAFLNML